MTEAQAADRLVDYVLAHTQRGECQCGRCIDKGTAPDPTGHTVDTGFFKVVIRGEPSRETFERLVRQHHGEFAMFDFDGINDFMRVGGWIGDQGIGMQCMALGHLLGCWTLVAEQGHGCMTLPIRRAADDV